MSNGPGTTLGCRYLDRLEETEVGRSMGRNARLVQPTSDARKTRLTTTARTVFAGSRKASKPRYDPAAWRAIRPACLAYILDGSHARGEDTSVNLGLAPADAAATAW